MMTRLVITIAILTFAWTGPGMLLGQNADAPARPQPNSTGPLTPQESLKRFQVAEDLEIEQVLAEPVVKQPVFLDFDERGRMWVVQYLQYPSPAGLRMLSRDNYWRAIYDKIPPPPPHHFEGRDKITIHEDTDGDGTFDRHKTFVDGLNIATAVTRGRGGVWVLNPPYLLFYPEANHDDVPDGDPVVHLAGFGLEDTHSVANSLRWGPDGWLYGAQGSTVTGNMIRPGLDKEPRQTMGQLIWRYHPETKRFEVFAEGGGNAFGVEIDSQGRIYSGHNGGNTRGFHYVQGGYFQKGFSKHGPLSNPYAFGYFPAMAHHDVQRFTHNFLIYDHGALPSRYQGKLFGVEPLQGRVVVSEILPDGSSFKTTDLSHPVQSDDPWFRPVDIKAGPDGAIYFADWYDQQVNHYRNHEGQIDASNGRIYRLKAKGARPLKPFHLAEVSTPELAAFLRHTNRWFRQTALRLLGDRRDPAMRSALHRQIQASAGQPALDSLWALNSIGALTDTIALELLSHGDPHVRRWTVRLIGDEKRGVELSSELATRLAALAASEPHLEARSQLAATSRRLRAEYGLPIVRQLLRRHEDTGDIHIPLLLWWSIEAKCDTDRGAVLALFQERELWPVPMVQQHILERLMRRFAVAGTQPDLATCAQLLELAPNPDSAARLLAGFEEAFKGRSLAALPEALLRALRKHGGGSLALRLRLGESQAIQAALEKAGAEAADRRERLQLIQVFGEVNQPACVPVLLKIASKAGDDALRKAALSALLAYDDPRIGEVIVDSYEQLPAAVRSPAETLLASRAPWSRAFLLAVDQARIPKRLVAPSVVRKMSLHQDSRIAALIAKNWDERELTASSDKESEIKRLATAVDAAVGDPYQGKKLYGMACASCHKLFDQGGDVGPDLTAYKRDDVPSLLLNIVHPSAEIREGFENYVVTTKDQRSLTGFVADQDSRIVVLRGLDGQNIVLPREEILEMKAAGLSLMPEGLLEGFNDAQVRDLFAYLRSTQPLND